MKKAILPAIILVFLLAPTFIWKYINDLQTRFTLAIFIIVMTGIYLFFTMKGMVMPEEEETKYSWMQLLLASVLLTIFASYSFRLFEVIKEIR